MTEDMADPTKNTEASLTRLQTEFGIEEGKIDMLIIDMPNIPPQQTPLIVMGEAVQQDKKETYSTIGVCYVAEKLEKAEDNLRVEYCPAPRSWLISNRLDNMAVDVLNEMKRIVRVVFSTDAPRCLAYPTSWIGSPIIAVFWKPATKLIDLNNEKRPWKVNSSLI
jgi:hypothetical protein